jgi:hypothetical protein
MKLFSTLSSGKSVQKDLGIYRLEVSELLKVRGGTGDYPDSGGIVKK